MIYIFVALSYAFKYGRESWQELIFSSSNQGISIGLISQSNRRVKPWLILVLHLVSFWHQHFIRLNHEQMPFFSF